MESSGEEEWRPSALGCRASSASQSPTDDEEEWRPERVVADDVGQGARNAVASVGGTEVNMLEQSMGCVIEDACK